MGRPARAESDLCKPVSPTPGQNTPRAIWKLPLFHNPAPALLAWYPMVWTVCLVCHTSGSQIQAANFFTPLAKHLFIVALTYTACRTLDNILHGNSSGLDKRSTSLTFLLCFVCLCWTSATVAAVYYLQGPDSLIFWVPTWLLSSLYPVVKSVSVIRQLVLGALITSVLLAACVISDEALKVREELILLGAFTLFWIIYIDTLSTAMDTSHDSLAYQNYLSPSPYTHLLLTFLALLQITALSTYSYQTNKSPHFWILGVGGWGVNIVWHISDLRNIEWLWNEESGGVAVKRNIWLGLWLVGAEVCELWVGGVLVF